jgi:FKBP-type peptidyl-prolyl cis-trans isomerase SlyD
MRIEKNKMVSLVYELRERDSDGRVIEVLEETHPLSFVYGAGRLLPYFESNINNLEAGDDFQFTLESGNAYGERREELVVDVPISVFESDGKLNEDICRVGNEVPMMDSNGNPLNGIINEISDTAVKMDFNHPMAGVDLYFTGKIIEVRDATAEEIAGTTHSCSTCGSTDDHTCCSGDETGCSGSCG